MSLQLDEVDLRPEIALAWRRAALTGLQPGMDVRESSVSDVDRRSRLAVAAFPVLDNMIAELTDTRFSVVLADSTSRIVDRRLGQQGLDKALDRVLAIPGLQYLEEYTGTNAIATAYELQRPIAVTGQEHYLEALRGFCCYGAPIIHPLTRRLEGVLDISGPVQDATPLLGPFLKRSVGDIQRRLLEGARLAEQRLLAAFQTHVRGKSHAVVVLGEDIVLTNPVANDLIHNSDLATLRHLAGAVCRPNPLLQKITLSSGSLVLVSAEAVPDSPGGFIFDISPVEPKSGTGSSRPRQSRTAHEDADLPRLVLVLGEPGTGRTTTGVALAGTDAAIVDAALAYGDDDEWLRTAIAAVTATGPTLIDNIHMLAPRLAARLAPAVRAAPGRVVMTSSPLAELGAEQVALAAEALDRHELRPVRTYQHDFITLANSVLREQDLETTLAIAPSALRVLAAQPWPGNIRELTAVLKYAARERTCGDIIVANLPPAYRVAPTRPLTLMEAAEREAILTALRTTENNKVTAAAKLGISRTTLYDRLKRYHIAD